MAKSKRGPRGRVRASPRARTALDATKGERPRGQAASRTRLGSGIRGRPLLISVALCLAVASCYLPVLDAEFITWDDPTYVTANPHLRGLSLSTTAWAFTTFYTGNWHPLTWLSLALDYEMYGLHPRGYHLTSLFLHVANTLLVFLVLHRLTGALWRSTAVAALFGLHPLHVESVAWVAERKDVLSALFWLLTIAAYLRYVRQRTWPTYALVVITFGMAVLSKPMVVTLPVILLLLDCWPLERLSRQALWEKIPLFLLALGSSASTVAAQTAGGAVGIDPIPLGGRVANAVLAYVKYLALTIWPVHLSPWYSHPALEGPPPPRWAVPGAAALLASVTALAILGARRRPYVAVGWLWYAITLLPVIGLIQVGRQGMADRYTYVPLVGIFIVLAWAIAELPTWRWAWGRGAGVSIATLVLMSLGALTLRQTKIWHDSITFWTYTAKANPNAFIAHQALGGLFKFAGRFDEAFEEYRRAARIRPGLADVHTNLGQLLMRKKNFGAAAAQYRKVVALKPGSAEDHNGLAEALLAQGRPAQARRHLERALAIQPGFAEAHNNLGRALLAEGRLDDAIAHFQVAVRLKPNFAAARQNLAATSDRRAREGMSFPE